jgi:hypothetical protein
MIGLNIANLDSFGGKRGNTTDESTARAFGAAATGARVRTNENSDPGGDRSQLVGAGVTFRAPFEVAPRMLPASNPAVTSSRSRAD